MTHPPKIAGKIVYFFGYPIFRVLIYGTTRSYVAICFEDTMLLTQNWLGFQKKWRLAGGGVHAGEDPRVAACRELTEELGVRVEPSQLSQISKQAIKAKFGYRYYLFVYQVTEKPEIMPDNREILSTKWVSKDKLKSHYVSEEVTTAAQLLGWL